MTARVTFVIPVFNAAGTLRETLASLAAQTMVGWDAVVVDDGSTDGSAELAGAFGDARVRVVSQENRGLAGTRNTGLRHADGVFVSFLDADDTVVPEYAEMMLGAIGGDDAVFCAYEMVGPDNRALDWVARPTLQDVRPERLIEANPFAVTGVVRLETLRRLGTLASPPARAGDVFDESLRVLEDWDLWLRLTANGMRWAPVVERPLLRYRLMPGLSRNVRTMWETGIRVIERASVAEALKARAVRRWALRHAAQALAWGDGALVERITAGLGDLSDGDLTILAEALSPSFQRVDLVGPGEGGSRLAGRRSRLELVTKEKAWSSRLSARFEELAVDWGGVAREVAAGLGAGEIATVYGMGRNGRALLTALARELAGERIAWVDDDPRAEVPFAARRIGLRDLTARHAVVVTPNAAEGIVSQLGAAGARVVWPRSAARSAA